MAFLKLRTPKRKIEIMSLVLCTIYFIFVCPLLNAVYIVQLINNNKTGK